MVIAKVLSRLNVPVVNLHMLTIEEEYCCWRNRNVKIFYIFWNIVHRHNVDLGHFGECLRCLCKL